MILNFENVSPKIFWNFVHPKSAFSPSEMSQRLRMSKGSKNMADEIMLICSAFASDSGQFLFCFVELRDDLTVTKV